MISKIQKAQKTTPKTQKIPPQNTKNLNSGSYDKLEENIPSPTFRVDFKKYFGNSKCKKKLKKTPQNTKNQNGG